MDMMIDEDDSNEVGHSQIKKKMIRQAAGGSMEMFVIAMMRIFSNEIDKI